MTRIFLMLIVLMITFTHAEARTIVLIGDSMTYGQSSGGNAGPYATPAALETLLQAGETGVWAGATTYNLGVSASSTLDWITSPPDSTNCDLLGPFFPILDYACDNQQSMLVSVEDFLGFTPDLVLINLGTNDWKHPLSADETNDNLETIAAEFVNSDVLIAPPFIRNDAKQTNVEAIRAEMIDRQILTGPDWPLLPFGLGVHLSRGGYAAAAGLWVDKVRAIP